MLILTKDLDFNNQVMAIEKKYTAWDLEDPKVYLKSSHGHRKAGRPKNYYLYGVLDFAQKIEAFTDDEAFREAVRIIQDKKENYDLEAETSTRY